MKLTIRTKELDEGVFEASSFVTPCEGRKGGLMKGAFNGPTSAYGNTRENAYDSLKLGLEHFGHTVIEEGSGAPERSNLWEGMFKILNPFPRANVEKLTDELEEFVMLKFVSQKLQEQAETANLQGSSAPEEPTITARFREGNNPETMDHTLSLDQASKVIEAQSRKIDKLREFKASVTEMLNSMYKKWRYL